MVGRDESRRSTAEELLLDFLDRLGEDEAVDFEILCAEHPEQASSLRALRTTYEAVEHLLDTVVRRGGLEPEGVEGAGAQMPAFPGDPAPAARYRIERPIGRGGMGEVFEAWDDELDRRLAMKVVRADRPGAAARFVAEARIMARLDHPGVVPVHELGRVAGGRPYFTMHRVAGRTFRELIDETHRRSGRAALQALSRAVQVLQRVCDTVAYAHVQRVVHRDLKPSNVMIGSFGEVFVMDWGLARDLSSDEPDPPSKSGEDADAGAPPDRTRTGEILGTAAYMAPEQAERGARAADERSDVYALGAMLYHLLSCRMPYQEAGESSTPEELIARVRRGPPRPLDDVAPTWAPDELISVCARAMARDRADRYATASDLAEDLRAWLEGRVVAAHGSGAVVVVTKWIRRNRLTSGALVLAVLATIAGLSGIAAIQSAAIERVRTEREVAEASAGFLETLFGAASAYRSPRHVTVDDLLETARASLGEDARLALTTRARLARTLAKVHSELARYVEAEELAERAVRLAEELHGPNTLETWARRSDLALVLAKRERAADALQLQRRVLETYEERLGPHDPRTVDARLETARLLQRNGRLDDALPLMEAVHRWRRADLGDEAEETAVAAGELGGLLYALRRYEEAAQLHASAATTLAATKGPDHPTTLGAENGVLLARMRIAPGEKAELAPPFAALLERATVRVGPMHPITLAIRTNLGSLLEELGELDEAESHLRTAVSGLERVNGPLDPMVLATEGRLAKLFFARGRYDDATRAYESLIRRLEQLPGMPDRRMLIHRRRLGVTLARAGDIARALEVLRGTEADAVRVLGDDDKETLETSVQLGALLVMCGEPAAAAEGLTRAATAARRAFGPLHGLVGSAVRWSYQSLAADGRPTQAERLLQDACDAALAVDDPDPARLMKLAGHVEKAGHHFHQDRAPAAALPPYEQALRLRRAAAGWTVDSLRTGNLLALVRFRGGDVAGARSLWSEIHAVAHEFLGDHDVSVNVAVNLAALELEHGDLAEADAIATQTLETARSSLGEDHARTLDALHTLASVRLRQARFGEARGLMESCFESRQRTLGPTHGSTLATLRNLVDLHRERGDLESARTSAELLVEQTPADDPEAEPRAQLLQEIRREGRTGPDNR